MIQSILFFALGFLCAGFLALMVGPTIWRRAVALTRKRVEAAMPLTRSEIQADKDRLRAEFAMSTRRLEMDVKALSHKAAEQAVEIGRGCEDMKRLTLARTEQDEALSKLETRCSELSVELGQRDSQVQELTNGLTEAEQALEARQLEFEKLEALYDEASFSSSSRQIELVARESELEKLADEISALRAQRKEADRLHQAIAVESGVIRDDLKAEKKKAAELDRKLERLMATVADSEEKLDRRDQELIRLREKMDADALQPVPAAISSAGSGEVDKAIGKLNAARERLEARLAALASENKKLKQSLAAFEKSKAGGGSADALLREQMGDLAAEVLNLTAKLEGPDSSIAKALAMPQGARPQGEKGEPALSLADRVRALQKAASAG